MMFEFDVSKLEPMLAAKLSELCPTCTTGLKEEHLFQHRNAYNFLDHLVEDYGNVFNFKLAEMTKNEVIGTAWCLFHRLSEGCIYYQSLEKSKGKKKI